MRILRPTNNAPVTEWRRFVCEYQVVLRVQQNAEEIEYCEARCLHARTKVVDEYQSIKKKRGECEW